MKEDISLGVVLLTVGAGLAAYEHVPYYGACPIAMGGVLLTACAIRWISRKLVQP